MDDENLTAAWEMPAFRRLLAAGEPGRALALVRQRMGLSQADFGRLLHWDRTHTGRVERGEVGTIYDLRELCRAADALGIPRTALTPLLLGTADPGTIGSGDEGAEDVNRRQFGLATTVALTATADTTSGPIKVGTPHITYLQNLTRRLWEHDNRFGGGGIARYAFEQYRLARKLLDYGEYGPRIGGELIAATGWLSSCVGWLTYDANEPAVSRRCYTDAVMLAEQSGDDDLLAGALGGLSITLTDHPTKSREPVRVTQRTSELARHVPSARLNALRTARLATAYAAVGDRREFERATNSVWREVDRGLDDANDPVWLTFVTEPELRVLEAKGHQMLGQHHQAATLFHKSLTRPHNLPRDEASYRTYYAASLTALGDTTEALTAAHSALDLLSGPVQSPRLLAELHPLRTAAHHSHSDAAASFRHRYDRMAGPGSDPHL
ncbi:helix-turn-helix domain-containing protein [Nocardia cyriacigeorgica]|uniref:helix-turn-helix domain-containing protein n=1 Tax=Nocardia cyriacigeorgica TaxID=135487 RepID=UPI0018933907|nr:helix-turn-helix transcriptional regulator [Nocardia cyriacigeorgica]MBF6097813.1 helix-turn-helix domain-containing protein [Nocardia cyriacigeorgica]